MDKKRIKTALCFLFFILGLSYMLFISPEHLLPQNITKEAINQIKFIKLESITEEINSPNIVQADVFDKNEIKKLYEYFSDIRIHKNIKVLNDDFNSMDSFIWISIFYEDNGTEYEFSFKINTHNEMIFGKLEESNPTYRILRSNSKNELFFSSMDKFVNSAKNLN